MVKNSDKPVLVYLLHEKAPPGKSQVLSVGLYGSSVKVHYWLMHPVDLPLFEAAYTGYTFRSLAEVLEEIQGTAQYVLEGINPPEEGAYPWFMDTALRDGGLDDSGRDKTK
jgi:hypothetical protein